MDPDDPTVARLATRLAQADVGAVLAGLANGVPTDAARPTQPSIALFEHMAERDDGLAVLLRSHRAVNAELWQVWAAFSDERCATGGCTARCSRSPRGRSRPTPTASAIT